MKSALITSSAALALGALLAGPLSANAASDHREFEGTVVHVSRENIKVHGVEGGKPQTLSFLINHGTKIATRSIPTTTSGSSSIRNSSASGTRIRSIRGKPDDEN